MNTRFSQWMLVAMMASFSMFALAQKPVDEAMAKQLKAALEIPGMGVEVRSVSASQIEGLYEVELVNGPILYSSAKGDYCISGEL